MTLFSELKRRNVFRVALLYLVAAWIVIQVADVGISLLGLPDWTGRLIVLLLLIGLPPVLIFSWVYEITPEGLRREKDVDRSASITAATARRLNLAVIVLLVLAIAALGLNRLVPVAAPPAEPRAAAPGSAGPPSASIAVLPFVNMSADQENEYFSDGLSEELLNLLARIPELRVAARTSAFSFKGSDADIGEIADKLNVAHVLEGSVRKSGLEIRITAQLINASDGYHLWSQTWDRKLTDVFAIQDEIASAVVDALKVSLLGTVPQARITDPDAYSLYLQSLAAANRRSADGMEQAVQLLTQALAIDPNYAEGWVELSVVQANRAGGGLVGPTEGYALAKAAAERALKIDPRLARAMSSLAWVAMYRDWDFSRAAALLAEARRVEPGNASMLNSSAVLQGIFGRYASQISLYEEALARDPVALSVLGNLAGAYMSHGRIREARALLERMREVDPESEAVRTTEGFVNFFAGDTDAALAILSGMDGDFAALGRAMVFHDLGRDAEADAVIETLAASEGGGPLLAGMACGYRGDLDAAFHWLETAMESRTDALIELRMYTILDPLHADPRWQSLLERIGISDADAARIGI